MKTKLCVILAISTILLTACGRSPSSSGVLSTPDSPPPVSAPESKVEVPSSSFQTLESDSQPVTDNPSIDSDSSTSPALQATDSPIQFYSSIEDVPYAELEYANDRKDLTKNGELWIASPYRFGEYCFSDGKTLFIQIDARENADDPEDFYWLAFCFDHFHPTGNPMVFPVESYNKLYVRAEGYTVFTDSGESLDIIKCPQ